MSYGKIFSSAFTGSLVGSGPVVFAVWSYVIANTVNSQVEMNPILVSAIIGSPVEDITAAIAKLCAPDPYSRNKEEDGRRLIKEGQYAYRVVSHMIYREMRNDDDRRAYNREKKKESRARSKKSLTVMDKSAVNEMSAQAEAEAEIDTGPPSPASHAKPGGRATANLSKRIEGITNAEIKQAIETGDHIEVLRLYGAHVHHRVDEWRRDTKGLLLGMLAAILDWRMGLGDSVREPSGFRKARAAWEDLHTKDRRGICDQITKACE